jgi:hypothetical protein
MLGEREVIKREIGETSVDDPRANIWLGHGCPSTARRAFKIGKFDDLYRGIDFAYQVALRWAGIRRIGCLDCLNRRGFRLRCDVAKRCDPDECDNTE